VSLTKDPLDPGYGGSIADAKQISKKVKGGNWLFTSHGIEKHADKDETWTPKKDVEDWKNNGKRPVPIPRSPCTYCEDHYWTQINMTWNSDRKSNLLSDAASPTSINTESKIKSRLLHGNVGQVNFTNLHLRDIYSNTQSLSNSPQSDLHKKLWREDRGNNRLTIENKPGGIDKGQVALKEVQPFHYIPFWIPNKIDLHPERKYVIPNKHCRSRDCGENQEIWIVFPIVELTIKALVVGPWLRSAKRIIVEETSLSPIS